MTIHSVTKMWSRAGGSNTMDDKQNVTSDFSGAYHVLHSVGASTDEILASVPVSLGDPFEGREYATVGQIGPVQPVGPTLSVVPVSAAGQADPEGGDDPLNAPPEIDYGSVSQQAETLVDGWGRPLTNTAGIQARGVMRTVDDFELSVKRNFIAVNGPLMQKYLRSTNSDSYSVLGDVWEPGQAGMVFYNAKPVYIRRIVAYFEVSCRIQFRSSHDDSIPKAFAWWHRYPSVGLKQRGLTVTFSGGGGSGAAGYAIVNSSKAITKVIITAPGAGYTSAPTGTITGGGGSGATFTSTLKGDGIDSITITNGGSNYVAGLVDCIDKNKKPVSSPVPLDASGVQADESFMVMRPERSWQLSYNALGLF